jgi:hypothetical protein
MVLNTHPHLVSRLKKEQRYVSIPTLSLRVLFQGALFTFTFYNLIIILFGVKLGLSHKKMKIDYVCLEKWFLRKKFEPRKEKASEV